MKDHFMHFFQQSGSFAVFILFFCISSFAVNQAKAEDVVAPAIHQERESYAKDFAQTALNILHDVKTPYAHRQSVLRQSFSDTVDIDWIGKFVLGRAWKFATDEQRDTYMSLYRRFLTEIYVTQFAENPENAVYDIKVLGVNDEKERFTVHSVVTLVNRNVLKVDYLVSDKNDHYKVMDIIIENVSLIETHRAQFTEIANNAGVDGVIGKLRELLDKPTMRLSMK